MSPILVRRGNILFLLKTPSDFIRKLKSGKIRPTDALFVRNGGVTEWVPISEIREFQQDSTPIYTQGSQRRADDLLDCLVEPGFNLRAFFAGPGWYFLHGMFGIGVVWLVLFAAGMLIPPLFVSWLGGNHLSACLALAIGWGAAATGCAWTADRAFNRHQLERSGHRSIPVFDPPTPEIPVRELEFDPAGSQFFDTRKNSLN